MPIVLGGLHITWHTFEVPSTDIDIRAVRRDMLSCLHCYLRRRALQRQMRRTEQYAFEKKSFIATVKTLLNFLFALSALPPPVQPFNSIPRGFKCSYSMTL